MTSVHEIPVAHTPTGGYGDEMPPPILAGCDDPLGRARPTCGERGESSTRARTATGSPTSSPSGSTSSGSSRPRTAWS